MKRLISIILAMLFLTACSSTEVQTPETSDAIDYQMIGSQMITLLSEEKYDALVEEIPHSEEMIAITTPEFYEELWMELTSNYGTFIGFEFISNAVIDGFEVYSYQLDFETYSIMINLVFSTDGLLSGINFQEVAADSSNEVASLGGEQYILGDEFPLEGELVIPDDQSSMPLVILVQGSGPSDRNETYLELMPFYDIAKGLQLQGIATYRYDKRTFIYGDEIDVTTFTIDDEIVDDAVTAFNQFNNDPRFKNNVYILGHSLGGHILPRIAEQTPDAKGYIFLAANYSPLTELIPYQVEYIYQVDGEYTEEEKASVESTQALMDEIVALDGTEEGLYLGAGSRYWKDLNDYDPGKEVKNIDKPMLFLQGLGDYQVVPEELDLWLAEVDRSMTTYYTFEGLTHFFTPAGMPPSPQDYEGPHYFDKGVIDAMAEWINE